MISRSSWSCPPLLSWNSWRGMSKFCCNGLFWVDFLGVSHVPLWLASVLETLEINCGGRVAAWDPGNTNCMWADLSNPHSCMKYGSLEYTGKPGCACETWSCELSWCLSIYFLQAFPLNGYRTKMEFLQTENLELWCLNVSTERNQNKSKCQLVLKMLRYGMLSVHWSFTSYINVVDIWLLVTVTIILAQLWICFQSTATQTDYTTQSNWEFTHRNLHCLLIVFLLHQTNT